MQLDGALGAAVFRLVEQARRQLDDAAIQALQFVLEAKLLAAALRLACSWHSDSICSNTVGNNCHGRCSLRMRPPQLTKQHGHELPPTGESTRVPLNLFSAVSGNCGALPRR